MAHEATIREVGVLVGPDAAGDRPDAGTPAVLLEARGEILPMFVDPGQARTIERAREGIPTGRPLTHDLFVDVLADLDCTLDRVRIDDLSDGTYHAKLDLAVERDGDRARRVHDARASDGLALAVRVGCPVVVADAVVDEAGQPPESLEAAPNEADPEAPAGSGLGPDPGSADDPSGTGRGPEVFDRGEDADDDSGG